MDTPVLSEEGARVQVPHYHVECGPSVPRRVPFPLFFGEKLELCILALAGVAQWIEHWL